MRKSHGSDHEVKVRTEVLVLGFHLHVNWLSNLSVTSSLVIRLFICVNKAVTSNDETSAERDNRLNFEIVHGRIWDKGIERSIVIADKDLTNFGTNDEEALGHPSVARISGGNISILVVYLSLIGLKFTVRHLVVFVCVKTCNDYLVRGVWVEGDLEVAILKLPILLAH